MNFEISIVTAKIGRFTNLFPAFNFLCPLTLSPTPVNGFPFPSSLHFMTFGRMTEIKNKSSQMQTFEVDCQKRNTCDRSYNQSLKEKKNLFRKYKVLFTCGKNLVLNTSFFSSFKHTCQ